MKVINTKYQSGSKGLFWTEYILYQPWFRADTPKESASLKPKNQVFIVSTVEETYEYLRPLYVKLPFPMTQQGTLSLLWGTYYLNLDQIPWFQSCLLFSLGPTNKKNKHHLNIKYRDNNMLWKCKRKDLYSFKREKNTENRF